MQLTEEQRTRIMHLKKALARSSSCGEAAVIGSEIAARYLEALNALLAAHSAGAQGDQPRNVEGMTREEFERYLRVCYQHDNVRDHVNAPSFGLTDDQKHAITERVELNYPSASFKCPVCGIDSPHEHSGDEIVAYRNAQRLAAQPQPMTDAARDVIRDITLLAGYAEGSKSPRMINAVRRVIEWLNRAEIERIDRAAKEGRDADA